jgi:hypothetical protein
MHRLYGPVIQCRLAKYSTRYHCESRTAAIPIVTGEFCNWLNTKIERINTSWTAQCSDVRLAKWAAEIVRAFVEEWWRVGRASDWLDRAHWEYGPEMVYPSKT